MTGSQVYVKALGPLEVTRNGDALRLGGLKHRMALGALVLHPNHVVPRAQLITALWEEHEPGDAVATLQVYIANLRRILDPERNAGLGKPLIESVAPGYRINATADGLDLLLFERLASDAASARSTGDLARTTTLLESALALWRGELLQDLQGQHFLHGESARWAELRLQAQRDLIETHLEQGRHEAVLPKLEPLLAANPYDERLAGLQILALYRSGRQAAALASFRSIRGRLIEELGVEPGSRLQQLELDVLNQEPALLVPVLTGTESAEATIRASGTPRYEPDAWVIVEETRVPLVGAIVTLGRLPDRGIIINDEQASRRHAEIRRSGDVFTLYDMGSTNGTFVNGEASSSHQLTHGDTIRIGEVQLQFVRPTSL